MKQYVNLKKNSAVYQDVYQNQFNIGSRSNSLKYHSNEKKKQIDFADNYIRLANTDFGIQNKLNIRRKLQNADYMGSSLDLDFKERQVFRQIQDLKKRLLNIFRNNNFENFSYFTNDQCKSILREKFQIQKEFQDIQNSLYKMPNINNHCLQAEKKGINRYLEVLSQDVLNKMLRDKINNVFQEQGINKQDIKQLMNKLDDFQEDLTITYKTLSKWIYLIQMITLFHRLNRKNRFTVSNGSIDSDLNINY